MDRGPCFDPGHRHRPRPDRPPLAGPGAPSWHHDETLLKIAHRARFAAIDEALKHHDRVDVYLIHTLPSLKALAKYQRHRAQIVTVDSGRDIVMQRVADMRDSGMAAVATRWYRARARQSTGQASAIQSSRRW